MNLTGSADRRYKLRHQLFGPYVGEIPPRTGSTGKEQYVEASLYYGVYPAFGGSARYYDSWRGQWFSTDPMAGGPAVMNSHAQNASLVNRTRNA